MEGELSSEESNVFPFSSKKFEQYISNSISKKKKKQFPIQNYLQPIRKLNLK